MKKLPRNSKIYSLCSYIFLRFKKKYYAKTANLLTGETAATLEEQAKAAEGI